MRTRVTTDRTDTRALSWNLRRLRCKITSLGRRTRGLSHWIDYTRENTYSADEARRKEEFIAAFLDQHPARRVLDLGCNTGRFSELAARRGLGVVAVDTDPACIDHLYVRTKTNGWDVTPLVVDIANPSPGIGFRNVERGSFLDRADFDCVFALALVHHLLVTSRLPLEAIVDLLADLTSEHLIVEFIEPSDEMFVSLIGARDNIYEHLTLDRFLSAFKKRFHLMSRARITDHRILVSLRKKP